ncbi:hypothetical protein L484_025387 [Morus notabilis]|uniref:Uncharacterized protein n=1 Tax=Morus notabilis TaxID=981085 RepID=W9RQR7_9ROSA|nr:hypothetical protein L484_025387 [Morus notabilis]
MGILFLHFSSVLCPGFDDGFGSAMEDDHDFGDLQGLLFMFSTATVLAKLCKRESTK